MTVALPVAGDCESLNAIETVATILKLRDARKPISNMRRFAEIFEREQWSLR